MKEIGWISFWTHLLHAPFLMKNLFFSVERYFSGKEQQVGEGGTTNIYEVLRLWQYR